MNPYAQPGVPPQAPGWVTSQHSEDEQHLGVLSICHFVYAGFLGLLGLVGVAYIVFGVVLAASIASKGAAPAAAVGSILAVLGAFVTVLVWAKAALMVVSGLGLRRKRYRTLSFVLACITCAAVPLGTLLGVFTIMVLSRPSVKALYDANARGLR